MWRILMYLREWWVLLKPDKFKIIVHPKPLPHVHLDFKLGWSRSSMKWLFSNQAGHYRDAFYQGVVWNLLPKRLIMWAAVRVMAHASTGQWGHEEVGTISMMTMLQRWETKLTKPSDDNPATPPIQHHNPGEGRPSGDINTFGYNGIPPLYQRPSTAQSIL